ncbi:hypothetical protein ISF_01593 [Cordyceps fumosorosea ARSEF 2679]|uniref:Uncharacterized protein n=1 Tax=Cordyceps fumosorosea (strain ARSEF 2679) TaxID=1081104 RepID=A0A168DER7_CORFA|nr:hypothetical protein ISF_01593 [Cordyceps fumosorosea ARSEF 2679]OAA72520.1 hypothetical protein ISF_01593 [Cordyceps fumosorosea ARSEF 2679]
MSRLEILRMYAANWRYLPPLLQGKTGFKAKRFDWDHRGPQHPVKQMAQLARVPMLQIPLGCSPEGVPHLLAGLDACDWLTHLKLSIAAEGLCGLMSNGAWRCWLPDLCKAALHLPNLVALEVAPDRDGGGWSNCHGKKELARAAEELMAACPGLEYVELERVAYGADCQEGVGRETERTWKKLTETDKELRRPPFFVQD